MKVVKITKPLFPTNFYLTIALAVVGALTAFAGLFDEEYFTLAPVFFSAGVLSFVVFVARALWLIRNIGKGKVRVERDGKGKS